MPFTESKVRWCCCVWQTQNRAAYYPTNQLAQLARPSPRWTAQGARPHRKSLLSLPLSMIALNSVAFTLTLWNTFSWRCSLLFVMLSPLSVSACNSIFFLNCSIPKHAWCYPPSSTQTTVQYHETSFLPGSTSHVNAACWWVGFM